MTISISSTPPPSSSTEASDAPRRPLSTIGGRRSARLAALSLAALTVVVLAACSLAFGARVVSVAELRGVIDGSVGGIVEAAVRARVPRTVVGIVVGAALGLAGAVMQGVLRNPLADPGILGVNSGAALAVVIGIVFFDVRTSFGYLWFALVGAAVVALVVYALGAVAGKPTPLRLTLAGAVTAAAASSITSALLLPRAEAMNVYRFWQVGGIGGAAFDELLTVAPVLALGAVGALVVAGGLDAMAMGDEVAVSLGTRLTRTRALAAASAVALCAAATAIAGPVAFVGLMAPHVARPLIGGTHRWLLPCSALLGAAVLLGADVVGRVLMRPADMDVGIVTAIIGAPVLVLVVKLDERSRR